MSRLFTSRSVSNCAAASLNRPVQEGGRDEVERAAVRTGEAQGAARARCAYRRGRAPCRAARGTAPSWGPARAPGIGGEYVYGQGALGQEKERGHRSSVWRVRVPGQRRRSHRRCGPATTARAAARRYATVSDRRRALFKGAGARGSAYRKQALAALGHEVRELRRRRRREAAAHVTAKRGPVHGCNGGAAAGGRPRFVRASCAALLCGAVAVAVARWCGGAVRYTSRRLRRRPLLLQRPRSLRVRALLLACTPPPWPPPQGAPCCPPPRRLLRFVRPPPRPCGTRPSNGDNSERQLWRRPQRGGAGGRGVDQRRAYSIETCREG